MFKAVGAGVQKCHFPYPVLLLNNFILGKKFLFYLAALPTGSILMTVYILWDLCSGNNGFDRNPFGLSSLMLWGLPSLNWKSHVTGLAPAESPLARGTVNDDKKCAQEKLGPLAGSAGVSGPRCCQRAQGAWAGLAAVPIQLLIAEWAFQESPIYLSVSDMPRDIYLKKINCMEKREWLVAASSVRAF